MNQPTAMDTVFLWTARLEGLSLIALMGVAMPLKYVWGDPRAVQMVGMAHGLLFIAYVALLFSVGVLRRWSWITIALGFISSAIPFGTFWFEARHLKQQA